MATTYTTNYNLGKQENHADKFDMDVITDNADKIDAALTGLQSGIDGKQAALTTEQLAAVNSGVTSTDVAQIGLNKNNISYNTNNGVKNLFNLTKVSGTYTTVVFTVNSDKTVTVNGTASPANSVFNLDDWTCTKAGTYVISGAPSGGSWAPSPNTYRIRVAVNGTWKGDDVGNGFALTLALGDVVNLQINTSTSYTANNLVFKPMITLKSLYDADPTYQPYAMSNAELTNNIVSINARYSDNTNVQTDIDNLNKSGIYAVNNTTTFTEAVPYQYGTLFHMEMVWWRMQVMFFASTSYSKPIFRMSNTNTSGGAASVWNKWRFFDGTLVNP